MTLHIPSIATEATRRPNIPIPSGVADNEAPKRLLADAAWSILRARRLRDEMLPGLFADPAWDIILFLFASEHSQRHATVSDACVAAAVPNTTALRFVASLEKQNIIIRIADKVDRRRRLLELSRDMDAQIGRWLSIYCSGRHSGSNKS